MNDRSINTYAKGLMGEDRACEYLQSKGMVLLERRYHSFSGEIDLIMRDGPMIVFVEVKARSRGSRGSGLSAITPAKQKKLIKTALYYISRHAPTSPMRFDAVEITPEGIIHIPNAFEASGALF